MMVKQKKGKTKKSVKKTAKSTQVAVKDFAKDMSKYNYTTIGAILALIVLMIGFIGSWYTVSGEFFTFSGSIDFGLMGTTVSGAEELTNLVASVDIETTELDTTMYVALITIILAFITLIGVLAKIFGFGEGLKIQKISESCGFLTFILAIITVVYFAVNIPDISGLKSLLNKVGTSISSGFGWGFYLFFIGAIILIITNFWSRIVRPE